nr:hypothetical protein [Nonomuraea candida]
MGVGTAVAQVAHGGCDDEIVGVPDGDRARRRRRPGGQDRLLGAVQQLLCLGQESRARSGQAAPLGGALQQTHAESVLQALDLTAQGRLGDTQFLGRPGEVQLLSDDREVPDQPKVQIGKHAPRLVPRYALLASRGARQVLDAYAGPVMSYLA